MKNVNSKRLVGSILILIFLGVSGFLMVMNYKINQLSAMTSLEMIAYTNAGRDDSVTSIGIISGDKVTMMVYGKDGKLMDDFSTVYEIGSLTKTFTGALLCKAQSEGRINLNDPIDRHLELESDISYPTIKSLATHTSGYKNYYLNFQMIRNKLSGNPNDYYGIGTQIQQTEMTKVDKPGKFKYSNFGIGVLGTVLSEIYKKPFDELMNSFIEKDLGLKNTRLAQVDAQHEGYWKWKSDDVYLASGGILSTIEDMTAYLRLQMSDTFACLEQGQSVYHEVENRNKQLEKMNIRTDAVGITWMIDEMNGFCWHNGGTTAFNSYIAFDTNSNIGVVILSNASPKYRIPATVIGPKLMMEQRTLARESYPHISKGMLEAHLSPDDMHHNERLTP
ncbi:MAG TPA: hypothetical protein DCS67_04655 [Clostridiales bacterium UBA8960]|nr:hypothetical protein [Clostridiales bacterium UBA8960]